MSLELTEQAFDDLLVVRWLYYLLNYFYQKGYQRLFTLRFEEMKQHFRVELLDYFNVQVIIQKKEAREPQVWVTFAKDLLVKGLDCKLIQLFVISAKESKNSFDHLVRDRLCFLLLNKTGKNRP